jgi:hypothetical protein
MYLYFWYGCPKKNLIRIACDISEIEWQLLDKAPRVIKTKERKKPENIKAQVVKNRNFKNLQTECEFFTKGRFQVCILKICNANV